MNKELSESEISMLLDVYMYTDYEWAEDGMSFEALVKEMPEHIDVKERYKREYAILSDAVSFSEIKDLKVCCQSQKMGFDIGTRAVTFVNDKKDTFYISFRGTYDGEWMDNAAGLTSEGTVQQKNAEDYFEKVVDINKISLNDTVILGGHSKGANKVQFITMDSDKSRVIDACYSIDGQGHSKEAVNAWKNRYTKSEYDKRVSKIYAINGENDYVSALGNSVIKKNHVKYIKTPTEENDFVMYHDITSMYAVKHSEGTKTGYTYSASRNDFAIGRGQVALAVLGLSKDVMGLPPALLGGVSDTAMQICEASLGGRKTGMYDERASLSDIAAFAAVGAPVIIKNLITTKEGNDFLKSAMTTGEYSGRSVDYDEFYVDCNSLDIMADQLKSMAKSIEGKILEIEGAGVKLPFYLEGMMIKRPHIEKNTLSLLGQCIKLKKAADVLDDISDKYKSFDMPKTILGLRKG